MHRQIRDRRKYFRFNSEIGSLNVFNSWSNEKLGDVINISKEGLSYRYYPNVEQPIELFRFDVFWVGRRDFLLRGIDGEAITDFDASKTFRIDHGKYRIRGIKFGDLTLPQESQLEHCILKHTLISDMLRANDDGMDVDLRVHPGEIANPKSQ